MRQAFAVLVLAACVLGPGASASAQTNTYVGIAGCGPCHKTEKSGNQIGVWEKTKHAEAYTALTTAQADEIAKAKGLTTPAAESQECLECHTITATPAADSKMNPKDGVQCEACHGPGSGYRGLSVMKDHEKSVAAGLADYNKDMAKIEALCVKCHNSRSPTMKNSTSKSSWPRSRTRRRRHRKTIRLTRERNAVSSPGAGPARRERDGGRCGRLDRPRLTYQPTDPAGVLLSNAGASSCPFTPSNSSRS